jgi:hypothetical protein
VTPEKSAPTAVEELQSWLSETPESAARFAERIEMETTPAATQSLKRLKVVNDKWLLFIDLVLATFLIGVFIMLLTGNL